MTEDWQAGGFGLYIHWPFCEAKCPYCDFNSHVRGEIDQSRWLRAYLREIDRYAELTSDRVLNSVFFGGGTPSLMEPQIVDEILAHVRKTWSLANDVEITLEANPSSVEAGRFAEYAKAGINRISMGVQALNDQDLRRLGRLHSVYEAHQAFDIARKYFDRVSFDLIYARQDQSLDAWTTELRTALCMAIDHLSLYQLTIEPGTAFGDRYDAGRLRGLPNEDLAADMYHATQDVCGEAGFSAYEVSNHTKNGAESRHNLVYWRYGDYIGIGPGAHGRVLVNGQKLATETWLNPEKWLSSAENGTGEKSRRHVMARDQAGEYLLMGLRLTEGIDLKRYERLAGEPVAKNTLDHLAELGLVKIENDRLSTTTEGRVLLNSVIAELLPD